jgi:glycoprotein 3-alpha-L-fucosyltransferase/alpha-1,3-fucosyltransferase
MDKRDWFPNVDRSLQQCNMQSCTFTSDRNLLDKADVVLFRGRFLRKDDLPQRRRPRQHFVFYEFEPPHKTWRSVNLTQFNEFFNLTSTFAFDSDIPYPLYRKFVSDPGKFSRHQNTAIAAAKRRDIPVAWFVSVYPTQSRRENYVQELQKYIGVDVYGKCGNLSCDRQPGTAFSNDDCSKRLLNGAGSYKFYLAFENSLCDDYVTEKLWKTLGHDVIPVVMGAVPYDTLLPKETFINVRDFATPKDLADYLQYLNQNDEAFDRYIRMKRSLKLVTSLAVKRECELCEGFQRFRKQQRVVFGLDDFWGSRRCWKPENFLQSYAVDDFGVDVKEISGPNSARRTG